MSAAAKPETLKEIRAETEPDFYREGYSNRTGPLLIHRHEIRTRPASRTTAGSVSRPVGCRGSPPTPGRNGAKGVGSILPRVRRARHSGFRQRVELPGSPDRRKAKP